MKYFIPVDEEYLYQINDMLETAKVEADVYTEHWAGGETPLVAVWHDDTQYLAGIMEEVAQLTQSPTWFEVQCDNLMQHYSADEEPEHVGKITLQDIQPDDDERLWWFYDGENYVVEDDEDRRS